MKICKNPQEQYTSVSCLPNISRELIFSPSLVPVSIYSMCFCCLKACLLIKSFHRICLPPVNEKSVL